MKKVNEEILWAKVPLKNRLFLAPMAGSTQAQFRDIAANFALALSCTELVSARGICYDPEFQKNARYLDLGENLSPTAIQLFGAEPEDFSKAIQLLLRQEAYREAAMIDINMGCPVEKVVKTGAGSALMRDPMRAARVVEASVKAAAVFGKEVTVKIRSGWDEAHINAPEFARIMQEAGAAAITLHARTRQAFYGGEADWELIGECANKLSIPLAANGDISSLVDCQKLLNVYGAEACMIGRAAVGRPWIFSEIIAAEKGEVYPIPSGEEWIGIIRKHLLGLMDCLGETKGVREFRSSLAAYIKGRPGAAAMRRELMQMESMQEVMGALEELNK